MRGAWIVGAMLVIGCAEGSVADDAESCGEGTVDRDTNCVPRRDLKIKSMSPNVSDGRAPVEVTILTENGCALSALTLKFGEETLENVRSNGLDSYVFTAPALEARVVDVTVTATCAAPPDASFVYGVNTASATFSYVLPVYPNPTTASVSPVNPGTCAPLDAVMTVTFSVAIDPFTVTKETFGISSITGTISGDSDNKTFRFKPDQPLQCATTYTCFVASGVQSLRAHKPLTATRASNGGAPSPEGDFWTFTTCPCS